MINIQKNKILLRLTCLVLLLFSAVFLSPLHAQSVPKKENGSSLPPTVFVEGFLDPIPMESAQTLPEFPGGTEGWVKFITGYRYPAEARANKVQGVVYLTFIVEKDGALSDVSVLSSPGSGTGEEAVRLLKTSPKWSPGVKNGLKVRVRYTQPIRLNLNQKN